MWAVGGDDVGGGGVVNVEDPNPTTTPPTACEAAAIASTSRFVAQNTSVRAGLRMESRSESTSARAAGTTAIASCVSFSSPAAPPGAVTRLTGSRRYVALSRVSQSGTVAEKRRVWGGRASAGMLGLRDGAA